MLTWSLRNPQFPERVVPTGSGVTALDFSTRTPNLLAVGLRDGTLAIYNAKSEGADLVAPVLDSSALPAKHMEPVWEVRWVDKGRDRGEALVSSSSDGRVCEWSTKKGLAATNLMVLRRSGGNAEGAISRETAGLAFAFSPLDHNTYYAGTADGALHKCSCSYNEQYLETYHPGHSGPVYKVRHSPFGPALLSCSADWTVKLWDPAQPRNPVGSFHASDLTDAVHDVAWSPTSSTVT